MLKNQPVCVVFHEADCCRDSRLESLPPSRILPHARWPCRRHVLDSDHVRKRLRSHQVNSNVQPSDIKLTKATLPPRRLLSSSCFRPSRIAEAYGLTSPYFGQIITSPSRNVPSPPYYSLSGAPVLSAHTHSQRTTYQGKRTSPLEDWPNGQEVYLTLYTYSSSLPRPIYTSNAFPSKNEAGPRPVHQRRR